MYRTHSSYLARFAVAVGALPALGWLASGCSSTVQQAPVDAGAPPDLGEASNGALPSSEASSDDGPDDQPPPYPPDSPIVVAGPDCSLQFTGAYDETPTCDLCGATLLGQPDQGSLTLSMTCKDSVHDYMPFQVTMDVTASTGPGVYPSTSSAIQAYSTATGMGFYVGSACSIELDAYAPRVLGGVSARIHCPNAPALPSEVVDVTAAIDLPAAALADAGPAVASGADAGGKPAGCSMAVTGTYSVSGTGLGSALSNGSSFSCSIDSPAGDLSVTFYGGPGDTGGVTVSGASWCASGCWASYYPGPLESCTMTTIQNDGRVGGRLVAGYACTDLTAPDGSQVSVVGTVDAIILAPPDG
jgi:hypothetical protein